MSARLLRGEIPAIPAETARGYTIALASAAVLSTTAIFIRHLTVAYGLPPLLLAFWREAFVVVALVPVLGLIRPSLLRVSARHLPYLAVYGAVLAAFNALWTVSVALNGAAVSTVLVYCSGAFTAVLGWWILGERLDWAKGVAVLLSLAGCALVSGNSDPSAWRTTLVGILVGALSGLGYAVYTLMGRGAALRGLNSWSALLYTFGFAAVFLLVVNLLAPAPVAGFHFTSPDLLWLGENAAGWGLLFLLAAGPTAGGYGLYLLSLVHLPSSVVNLVAALEVPFTAGLAYLLLGERLSALQVAGGILIVTAVVLLRTRERKREETTQQSNPAPSPVPEAME